MAKIPERITGAWLNSLPVEERIEVLRGPFGRRMHTWAASHVTYIRWASRMRFGEKINNGSIFFLDIGGDLFAVTARHVYDGYLADKQKYGRVTCYIENIEFDPEKRLRGYRDNIDIVTFNISYDELRTVAKQAIVSEASAWPPPHPISGQTSIIAGFPAASRLWVNWRSISFGLYIASPRINSVSDRQITCPLEREFWVDTMGRGLPPKGFDLGGISGGPLLMPMDTDGSWNLYLGGVISEAPSKDFETVVSVPAHFIAADGKINDERSSPIRHVV